MLSLATKIDKMSKAGVTDMKPAKKTKGKAAGKAKAKGTIQKAETKDE